MLLSRHVHEEARGGHQVSQPIIYCLIPLRQGSLTEPGTRVAASELLLSFCLGPYLPHLEVTATHTWICPAFTSMLGIGTQVLALAKK